MDAIDLAGIAVQSDVLNVVSGNVAEIYGILPLRFEDDGRDLVIATSDPQNLDALADLGFMLSRRIIPVRAEKDAVMAAIERLYVPLPMAEMPNVLSEIARLDARGPVGVVRDWLRRLTRKLTCRLGRRDANPMSPCTCPPHHHFANHVILAIAESGTKEATVETSKDKGRFHYVTPGGERVDYRIPPKWARRIIRRIAWLAKGSPEHAIPEGRIDLRIRGEAFDYDVTRKKSADGESLKLWLLDRPSSESQRP